jgi:sialate O-acetylesterase
VSLSKLIVLNRLRVLGHSLSQLEFGRRFLPNSPSLSVPGFIFLTGSFMTPRHLKRFAIACICLINLAVCSVPQLRGDISLPKLFSDHMVLQRDSQVQVWGVTEASQKLIVKFNGQESKTTANANGEWGVVITTPGAGGPYQLEVVAESGEPKVVFNDVMVGEVWVCAGQCNMDWPVSKSLNAENEISLSKNFPEIRLFSVADGAAVEPLYDFAKAEPWSVCSPDTVKDFSATAYFFGREISKKLKENQDLKGVPIGLIDASYNQTVCEAWASRKSLEDSEALKPLLQFWDEGTDQPASPSRPGTVFNAMIAPMTKFPIRGVVWYQGEANIDRGDQYRTLLPALIQGWRTSFGNEKLPFYIVQLAPFRYEQKPPGLLAEIRDAQLKTLKSDPHSRMVVTTDVGDLAEFNPKNKQVVGQRLALIALKDIYADLLPEKGKIDECSGPIFESSLVDGNQIRISFKHASGGLKIGDGGTQLTWFVICGKDKIFVPAVAKIDGETILVSSPDVEKPVAVRFAWDDSAQPNLFNSHDLPASPFRTDEFSLISEGRDF